MTASGRFRSKHPDLFAQQFHSPNGGCNLTLLSGEIAIVPLCRLPRMRKRSARPQLGACALVLWRTVGLGAEYIGRMPGPAWVVEETAGERHPVGTPFGDYCLRLMRVGD